MAAPTLLGPLVRAGFNTVGAAIILTEDGDGVLRQQIKSKNMTVSSAMHHHQNPLEFIEMLM